MIYQSSCHCHAITFEVEAPENIKAEHCNCSVCAKSGFLHLIVPLSKFRLLSGKNSISTYTFNSGIAKHTFCKRCGIKPFYTPRSNPDDIDVNINCLDTRPISVSVTDSGGKTGSNMHTNLPTKAKKPERVWRSYICAYIS